MDNDSVSLQPSYYITVIGPGRDTLEEGKLDHSTQGDVVVSFEEGATINLGDYNSARVKVGVAYPCSKEELDSAFNFIKSWVDNKLQQVVTEIQEDN